MNGPKNGRRESRRETLLGRYIKGVLAQRGMSQTSLAERMNSSGKHVSRVLGGYSQVTPTWLIRMAEVLDIDPMEACVLYMQDEVDYHYGARR